MLELIAWIAGAWCALALVLSLLLVPMARASARADLREDQLRAQRPPVALDVHGNVVLPPAGLSALRADRPVADLTPLRVDAPAAGFTPLPAAA